MCFCGCAGLTWPWPSSLLTQLSVGANEGLTEGLTQWDPWISALFLSPLLPWEMLASRPDFV